MKAVTPRDRPREKIERAGVLSLGDNELLALVIGHGTAKAGALEVANRVLVEAGGVHGLLRVGREELARVSGIGSAIASRVLAALELGRRTLAHAPNPRPRFATSIECGLFLLPQFGSHPVERFGLMLLDSKQYLIRAQLLTVGSIDAVIVHPRDVFRAAILAGASTIVAFHNHPTGVMRTSGLCGAIGFRALCW